MVSVERKRPMFEGRPEQFPPRSRRSCAKTQNPKAAPPSEPSMTRGRSVSRKRSVKGKSNPGIILRQPCRYDLKGACTRTLCEHWHPPECQFHKNETGCTAEDKCLFPNHKVDEQQSRKRATILQKEEKATTKMQWLKIVSQMGCVARLGVIGFSKRQTSPGKPDAKSLGTDSKNTIHSVYATSTKYPEKEETFAWKNKILISEVPTL